MAATSDTKVVSIASRRKSLFGEVAGRDSFFDQNIELFDVNNLVLDSRASRSDLRIIEASDDEVQQCIETRMDTLVGVDWRLDGGSEEVRDWLTEQVKRHYDGIVRRAWTAKLYGYSVLERIWAKEDNYYVVERVSEKPFEWFIPKRDGTLWYKRNSTILIPTTENTAFNGVQVDTNFKFLVTKNDSTWLNPRGKPLLAYLFWPWFYRKATWQFWMQFLERNGQPLLVGKGDDPAQIASQLALAVQDAVIGVPRGTEVDAISPANKGEAFNLAEDRLVRRIQKVLLGQTLTSDVAMKGSGAKALGEVHNEVRLDKTIGDLKLVGPTIQNYIDALRLINFPSSRPVNLVYAVDRGLETARANRDAALVNSGNITFTEEYFIREYGFKKGDFIIVDPAGKKQTPEGNKQTNEDNSQGGSKDGNTKGSDSGEGSSASATSSADERAHTLEVVKEMGTALVTAVSQLPQPKLEVTLPAVTVQPPEIHQQIELHATLPTIKQTVTKHIVSKQIGDGHLEATVTEEVRNDA